MYLKRLLIHHFKSYETTDIAFCPGFNCIYGLNGTGKTNLLDAIYYICMTKSYFGLPDTAVIAHNATYMRLDALFELDQRPERIVIKYVPKKVKTLERQQIPLERLSDHIGFLPIVIIAPDDTELLTEGSDARRRFLNNTLSQMDPRYLSELMLYNRVLLQRNTLLKQMGARGMRNDPLLDIYTQQLIAPAQYIFKQRQHFLDSFSSIFAEKYQYISQSAEPATLEYQSALHTQSFEVLLERSREKDLLLQRTTEGIHRDDLDCKIEQRSVKKYASQGQRKSYLIALKLAQLEILHTVKGVAPLLLLDDLFEKLDPIRTHRLFELLSHPDIGQVFITDTHDSRLQPILSKFNKPWRLFHLDQQGIALVQEGGAL